MPKNHTRQKRSLRAGTTHRKHRFWFTRVVAKVGARSFASKEAAQTYAKEHKLDTKALVLHETPSGKFQWRATPRV